MQKPRLCQLVRDSVFPDFDPNHVPLYYIQGPTAAQRGIQSHLNDKYLPRWLPALSVHSEKRPRPHTGRAVPLIRVPQLHYVMNRKSPVTIAKLAAEAGWLSPT